MKSDRGGGKKQGRGGNNGVRQAIPKYLMETIQRVKEVVKTCSDDEIHAMLKECNMDPNEAVERLLSQDHFHEVKSRREKKKEVKEASESLEGLNSGSTRNLGRGGSMQFCSSVSEASGGKPTYKEENRSNSLLSNVASASATEGNNHMPLSHSNSISQSKRIGAGDHTKSSPQPPVGSQSTSLGVSGPLSMADIVKMGRVHDTVSSKPNVSTRTFYPRHGTIDSNTPHLSVESPSCSASLPEQLIDELLSSEDCAFKESEKVHVSDVSARPHVHSDEWPSVEQSPKANGPSVSKPMPTSEVYADPSLLSTHIANLRLGSQSDYVQVAGNSTGRNFGTDHIGSDPAYSIQSHCDRHGLDQHEVKGIGGTVSVATTNPQHLYLHKDELEAGPAGSSHTVNTTTHMQAPTLDLSNFKFGSYDCGSSATSLKPFMSKPLITDSEEISVSEAASSAAQSVTRNLEYYGHEHLKSLSDRNLLPRVSGNGAFEYIPSQYSQPDDVLRQQFSSSLPAHAFERDTQMNAGQAKSQQAYANPLPRNLWASTIQPSRDPDFSSINKLQSLATMSSIYSPTISMKERFNTGVLSASEHKLQPNISPGSFTDIMDYNSPWTAAYMASASQQRSMLSNNAGHDADIRHALSQIRNSRSVSTLSHSASAGSRIGDFGGSSDFPGSYRLNLSTTANKTSDHYDLFSQYNDSRNSGPIVQNEHSVRWAGGLGSRTMPSLSEHQHYDIQAQNSQLRWELQQGQPHAQQNGALNYSDLYGSQIGTSREHQEQILGERYLGSSLDYQNLHHSQMGAIQGNQDQLLRDRTLDNSQVPRYSQSRQFWENY